MSEVRLTLYSHPLASYCWKALLALYETDRPFLHVRVDGPPKTHETLSKLWPIAKMPLLYDAARQQAIPETSVIIEYLEEFFPSDRKLLPQAPALRLEVRLWDRFFDLYVQTPMQKLVSDRMRPETGKDPLGVEEAGETLDTAYAMLEKRFVAQSWAVGENFSMADCSAMPALFYAEAVRPFAATHAALGGYFARLMDRPAPRRIIREAQPYFQYFPFRDALDPRFLGGASH